MFHTHCNRMRFVFWTLQAVFFFGIAADTASAKPQNSALQNNAFKLWAADPLAKIFKDTTPDKNASALALSEVARGQTATLQIVIRPTKNQKLQNITVSAEPFTNISNASAKLTASKIRFVGYVHVAKPTPRPDKDQLRKPPADYPDVLLEQQSLNLEQTQSQPIWLTIPIPTDTPPGTYTGKITVTAIAAGRKHRLSIPAKIIVYPPCIIKRTLHITNWFTMNLPRGKAPQKFSIHYWHNLKLYARNMAQHHQNVALTPTLDLCRIFISPKDIYTFNFANFDEYVQIFIDNGVIGLIEGGHIGSRVSGADWFSQFLVRVPVRNNKNKITWKRLAPTDPAADNFYSQFFPALVKHLKEKGWLNIYIQHVADEPIKQNITSYRQAAELVRKYAPELKIIEACHTKDLAGSIDIWVPQLNFFKQDYNYYIQRQGLGEEVWFYTCMHPQGNFPNRFIEQPLIKTRLLHWINFKYNASGYLHWGYNWWKTEDPFKNTTPGHYSSYLPAGDAWIVYPKPDGGVLDSIRFEAMRDGIDDYELLKMLKKYNEKEAFQLAEKLVPKIDSCITDISLFRKTRRQLLNALSDCIAKPTP